MCVTYTYINGFVGVDARVAESVRRDHLAAGGVGGRGRVGVGAYMLNTWSEEYNTVFYFYSYSACFMNTVTLNMHISMSYTGFIRRNTVFVFVWLRPRNT